MTDVALVISSMVLGGTCVLAVWLWIDVWRSVHGIVLPVEMLEMSESGTAVLATGKARFKPTMIHGSVVHLISCANAKLTVKRAGTATHVTVRIPVAGGMFRITSEHMRHVQVTVGESVTYPIGALRCDFQRAEREW